MMHYISDLPHGLPGQSAPCVRSSPSCNSNRRFRMGSVEEAAQVRDAPVQGRITDEAIAAAKAMIGMRLRPEGPYLQDATVDTIRNFCNGVGDLNPLYRDSEYGRGSRYANVVAHPMFPMAYGWLGRTRWGLPGVHGFYAGN